MINQYFFASINQRPSVVIRVPNPPIFVKLYSRENSLGHRTLTLKTALFPSAIRMHYLARLPAGTNDLVNPVDPV